MHDAFEVITQHGAHDDTPIVATAIHDGHALSPEVLAVARLDAAARLREEDPHTGRLTSIAPTRFIARRSRFELDLNRPRERAVYASPADAWGLDVVLPEPAVVARSLSLYDDFYAALGDTLRELERRHGRFVVLDLHSYNHRRAGPDAPPADAASNPEINVGTKNFDRRRWGPLVDRFVADLGRQVVAGHTLDVRENVKFGGGHLSYWLTRNFPRSGCVLAIELKKTFMDEWTGALDEAHLADLELALAATVPGLLASLAQSAS